MIRSISQRVWFFLILMGFAIAVHLLFFGNGIKHNGSRPAPLFSASFGDRQFHLQEAIGQKIILINFWATWCPSCRDEIMLLNQLAQTVGSPQFQIVAVMEDNREMTDAERQQELNAFTKIIPIHYPVFADPDGRIANAYGTFQLPESYLINAEGEIIDKQIGPYFPQDMETLAQKIKTEIQKL